MPDLAEELASLLVKHGRSEWAEQVTLLRVVDRCRCQDRYCAMFYTAARPQDGWGAEHENVNLEPERGMLVLDVVNGKIAAVECLYRPEVRELLLRLLP